VDEMLGVQRYPEVKPAANSGILEPYDVAAWSLPLMMGVKAERVHIEQSERDVTTLMTAPIWPTARLAGAGKFYSIPVHQNNVFALANAMNAAGAQVFLARNGKETPAVIFAAHPQLSAAATKFHIVLQGRADLP